MTLSSERVARRAGASVPARAILMLVAASVSGCGSREYSPDRPGPPLAQAAGDDDMFPGSPADCAAHCVPEAVSAARARLGLDPLDAAKPEISADPAVILRYLQEKAGAAGGRVEVVDLPTLLDRAGRAPSPASAVLLHADGHLCLLLGVVDIGGEALYEVVHGDGPATLSSKSRLSSMGFRGAWRLHGRPGRVPLLVGSGLLSVDKLWHGLGELKPAEPASCTFSLRNAGESDLILSGIRTSCSCTTTRLREGFKLRAGEATEFEVDVHPTNLPSQRLFVTLDVIEVGSGESREVVFSLFGVQRESMRVVPNMLDFGRVARGKSYERTIRVEEVPTDRFAITDIRYDASSMSHKIMSRKDRDGLSTHLILFNLRVDRPVPGRRSGEILLMTDSRLRPEVKIPVSFEVPPPVRAMPSIVSLGSVGVGEVHRDRVRFLSSTDEPVTIEAVKVPPECSVEPAPTTSPPELVVSTTLRAPGAWRGEIEVRATTPSGVHPVTVRCVGYAR